MSKRTLDAFFKPSTTPPKRPKTEPAHTNETSDPNPSNDDPDEETKPPTQHPNYPIPIPQLPSHIEVGLEHATPASEPRILNNQPNLDLLHFQPYIPRATANELFKFLRRELPFYRVQYTARRGPTETQINTPRWTTVFGVDETSTFTPAAILKETKTNAPTPPTKYKYKPRPIPACLDLLRKQVEAATAQRYNFCLVNYYASGEDSIAFHADDERFLGPEPTIASLSLGGERDFLMKHKPFAGDGAGSVRSRPGGTGKMQGAGLRLDRGAGSGASVQIKMGLGSGDMVVMRGATQANWLHSIPKRKGMTRGRINITFRRAVVPGGTDNYYHYNVGSGGMYRWDEVAREMVLRDGKV